MAQPRAHSLVRAKDETHLRTSRANAQADVWYYIDSPHRAVFDPWPVQNYINNVEPGFEVPEKSIRSESPNSQADYDNYFPSSDYIALCAETIKLDMAEDMTHSLQGDQEHSEAFSTGTWNRTDRVDQQFPHVPPASMANSTRLKMGTTELSQLQGTTSIVYDIATLLKLRQEMYGKRVELRINPVALAENVFKDSNNTRLTQPKNMFSRGLSGFIHRSIDSDEELTFQGRVLYHPSRQPRAPPETPHAQQNEGFARFLKEHASPPHHRVTAGGRIVPAGPLSPPPMLTLDSVMGTMEKESGAVEPSGKLDRTKLSSSRTQATNTESCLDDFVPGRVGNTSIGNSVSTVQTQRVGDHGHGLGHAVTQPPANATYAVQPMAPMVQFPSGPMSTVVLQDGSTIYSFNGLTYRCYWNGTETVVESLSVSPATPVPHDRSMAGLECPQAWFAAQSVLNIPQVLGNVANGSQAYLPALNQDIRAPVFYHQFENLKFRLMMLDKCLALHRHELPPTIHAGLVAQRKELVEQLDSVRVAKEQIERSGSTTTRMFGQYSMANIINPQNNFGPQGTGCRFAVPAAIAPPNFTTPGFTQPQIAMRDTLDQAGSTANNNWSAGTNKGLSPNAPTFIPSFAQQTFLTPSNSHGNKLDQHEHPIRTSGVPDSNKSLRASHSGTYEVNHAAPKPTKQMHSEEMAVAHRSQRVSVPRSSSQDMLPVVSDQEAEYVDRLGLNPAAGPQLYCSIPAEFQEVIRRAREQATLFGCLGGQSKDPAYDAEQDIRWAMSDFEPVPLPKRTPDHVGNPRPWNWQDSAYNHRVIRQTTGSPDHSASQNFVSTSSKYLKAEAKPPSTPLKIGTDGSKLLRRVSSWDSDYGQGGLFGSNPAEYATSSELQDAAPSRGPLFTRSGNSCFSLETENHLKDEPNNFKEIMAKMNANEKPDTNTHAEKQPETPCHRQYHAYVESYSGSPLTPTKSTTQSVPPKVLNDGIIKSVQTRFDSSTSDYVPAAWGPVTESKDRWGPDQIEDTLSTDSWDQTDLGGRQRPAPFGEKAAKNTPTVKLPVATTGFFAEPCKNLSSTTPIFKTQAIVASEGVFNTSNTFASTQSEVKDNHTSKKNTSMDSSSVTSNKSKHEFLRGMLDSALYSSARADLSRVRHARYIPPSERENVAFPTHPNGWEDSPVKKENVWSEGQYKNDCGGNRALVGPRVSLSDSVYFGQDARAIKAPSSLASSKHHAQAHMPQYDGTGNQLASTSYRGFMPPYQNANDRQIAPQAASQANRDYQSSAVESFNRAYRNERKAARDAAAGHFSEDFLNTF